MKKPKPDNDPREATSHRSRKLNRRSQEAVKQMGQWNPKWTLPDRDEMVAALGRGSGETLASSRGSLKGRGWFEEYRCGCVSEIVKTKRELLGYCGQHGDERRQIFPYLRKWVVPLVICANCHQGGMVRADGMCMNCGEHGSNDTSTPFA